MAKVILGGTEIHTSGNLHVEGEAAPDFYLTDRNLKDS